ncbi:MAG TPA: hypothetical protein VHV78_02490 [Gemmatimonadaceae bacterium]|jgi:hypothetical protein|nr:hypothetical protein [Gemmatimonadaceae bacterium]
MSASWRELAGVALGLRVIGIGVAYVLLAATRALGHNRYEPAWEDGCGTALVR